MPASWSNFVSNVTDKFTSQSLNGNQETANYLTDQYLAATVGKAQSPFGNTHVRGQRTIMATAFKKGLDELFKRPSPTFKEREEDPMFSDLTGDIPAGPSGEYKIIKEYQKWADENPNLAPNFIFTPLFEDPSVYPSTLDQAIPLLAQKVLSQFDGTSEFYEWLGTLPVVLGNTGKRIYDQFNKIITDADEIQIGTKVYANAVYRNEIFNYNEVKALEDNIIYDRISTGTLAETGRNSVRVEGKISKIITDKLTGQQKYFVAYTKSFSNRVITVNKEVYPNTITVINDDEETRRRAFALKSKLNFTNKVFQSSSSYDDKNIPSWVDQSLIVKLTYVKSVDKEYSKARYDFFGNRTYDPVTERSYNIRDTIKSKNNLYGNSRTGQVRKWFDALITWGNFLADEARNLNNTSKGDENDPYEIMAKGVIGYWISTLVQPLGAAPPVPPCSIPTPGTYTGLFYGNQKFLADNLRRAFNTGKTFKDLGSEKTAARAVAKALAISFALHLSELKFLYTGSIPTPGGTAPMIGFVPLVY